MFGGAINEIVLDKRVQEIKIYTLGCLLCDRCGSLNRAIQGLTGPRYRPRCQDSNLKFQLHILEYRHARSPLPVTVYVASSLRVAVGKSRFLIFAYSCSRFLFPTSASRHLPRPASGFPTTWTRVFQPFLHWFRWPLRSATYSLLLVCCAPHVCFVDPTLLW